jgi:hypothetical protein
MAEGVAMTRYAVRDLYAVDDRGVRRLVATEGSPVPVRFEQLVDRADTTTEPPAAPAGLPVGSAEGTDYSKLTKAELQEQLEQRGIEFSQRWTKAALIELLEAA